MTLAVKTKKTKDHRLKLDISIPYERLQVQYEKVRTNFAKGVKMPGFRKGKVPSKLIDKHYKEAIQAKTIENIIAKVYDEAVQQEQLDTYGQPVAEHISEFKENEPLQVSIVVDKKPSCSLHYDKKLKLVRDECIVEEEDIDREVRKTLRERKATTTPKDIVEHNEDIVYFNLHFEEEALKKFSSPDQKMPMDEDLFRDSVGLRRHFWKMKAGEEKTIQHTWPTANIDKDLAGKTTNIRLEVVKVEHVDIPSLTDNLAKELGYESKEDMLKKVRSSLSNWAEEQIQNRLRSQALKHMKQKATYEISESVVRSMGEYYTKLLVEKAFGGNKTLAEDTLQKSGKNLASVRADHERTAKENLKTKLFMAQLIKENKIEVSEKTMEERLQSLASSQGKNYETLRRTMLKNGDFVQLRRDLQEKQALDFLLEEIISIKKGKQLRLSELLPNQ